LERGRAEWVGRRLIFEEDEGVGDSAEEDERGGGKLESEGARFFARKRKGARPQTRAPDFTRALHATGGRGGRTGDSQASLGGDGPFRRAQQANSSSPVCVRSEIGLNI